MRRYAIALILFVSLTLPIGALSQDKTPSSPTAGSPSQEPAKGSPAATSGGTDEPVLKLCSPKNPRPCINGAPRALYEPPPAYSKEARKKKIQGTVVLILTLGSDGLARNIRVARTLGYGLDEEAIKAVKKWKFTPATMDGQPVAVMISVQVNFRLH